MSQSRRTKQHTGDNETSPEEGPEQEGEAVERLRGEGEGPKTREVARAAILKRRRSAGTDELTRSGEHSAPTENDWWARMVEDEAAWGLDDLPSIDLTISVDEMLVISDDEGELASRSNVESDGFKTMPGLLVEEGDELLWMILSVARENPEAHCLELVDIEQVPFAELIIDQGRVGCGVFLERKLMIQSAEGLSPSLRSKLQAMADCAFEDAPWLTAAAWDWSLLELDMHQRHNLAMLTAHALTQVIRSPRTQGASIRSHPIELKPDVLLSFSPVELSLAMDAFLDLEPPGGPALNFYQAHAHRAQQGGLLRRDDRMPGALRPTRMVCSAELTYQDKRALRLAAEELTLLHTQLGLKDNDRYFQISHTEDGFWVVLSSPDRVAMLRFPSSLMGLIYGEAMRMLNPSEDDA